MRFLPPLLLLATLAGCGDGTGSSSGGAAGGSYPPTAARPTPTPAGGAASSSPAASASGEPAPLRYAVLGDSYSNGQSAGATAAWPSVMATLLTRDGLPTRVVANPSVTGATTAEMLRIGIDPIRASRPDVMTVMLGVNDQVQGHSTREFAADEDRALEAAIEITGAPERVLAVDIPDYSMSPAGRSFGSPAETAREIDAFNAVVRRVAARRGVRVVSVVDISRRLGAAGIGSDGLHPNAAQLAEWARRIAPAAREAWGGPRPRAR